MPSITDRLAACGAGWSALSSPEASEAARACWTCADNPGQAYQALSAYLFLVSLRSNTSCTTYATDAEVAACVPKTRGDGCLSADAYRKRVKPLLEGWGLVSCSPSKPTGAGRRPTLYYFPLLGGVLDRIDPTGQSPCGLSGWG